jgi:hypothetical protein
VFTVKGLPEGTGFRMSKNGVFSGIPTEADFQSQPALVVVTDEKGGVTESELPISVSKRSASSNHVPDFMPIKPVDAFEGRSFSFDLSLRFIDQDSDRLTFSMAGLPQV